MILGMRRTMRRAALATTALAVALAAGLAGCSAPEAEDGGASAGIDIYDTSGGVAATVNGTEIGEAAVTAYIADFRELQGLQEDDDWAQWLFDNGYTVDSVRGETVDYFVSQVLLRQAADKEGVSVSDDEVSAALAEAKAAFEADEDWESQLEGMGLTEGEYRDQLELSLLSDKLEASLEENVSAPDSEVLSSVAANADAFAGSKRSRQIVFATDDEQTAQEVLDKINAGELSFDEAADEYSLDRDAGGDVGWDKAAQLEDEYQAALDELSVGEMSGLVKSDTGIRIILCTDELVLPEDGEVTAFDQVSEGFVDYIRARADESAKRQAFDLWMTEFKDDSDIHQEMLPKDAPYWVDLAPYEEKARADAAASQADAGDAGADADGQEAGDEL